jgi:MFS family permease
MANRRAIVTVYGAGVVQGLALVTFPAAGAIFTGATGYGLTGTQYGGMFVPQAIMAIGASLLGAGLMRRLGLTRVYQLGLIANALAMLLLVASTLVAQHHPVDYLILLAATACLGIGFGFTVPALNTFTALLLPAHVDRAVLGLNALLGVGTALAPVLFALFVGLGCWWGLPVLGAGLVLFLLILSTLQILVGDGPHPAATPDGSAAKSAIPTRFWTYATFALLYGICETVNGNWAALYMNTHFSAKPATAALSLTLFWAMVTCGRILIAAIEHWFPEPLACRVLPLVVAGAFVLSAMLPHDAPTLGLVAFAVAGLGCSALLPLSISFAQKELTPMAATVASGLIAFYQIGYGIAAFGVGPLHANMGIALETIYGGATAIAAVLAVLAFLVTRPPSSSPAAAPAPTT